MFYIRMAELDICIDNKYGYVERLCRDYIIPPMEEVDIFVSLTDEEIDREISASEIRVTEAYAEGVCIYRAICRQLPTRFNAFLFHSAVIEYEGRGYAFAAQSGTGKSTHISLWREKFGDNVKIINGDKPILKFDGDRLLAYGTPWCGKEGLGTNASTPVTAICFIERAEKNSIRCIKPEESVMRIFHQILTPDDLQAVDSLFPLLDKTLRLIPCYVLGCNISTEAAEIAYNGMKQVENEKSTDERKGI